MGGACAIFLVWAGAFQWPAGKLMEVSEVIKTKTAYKPSLLHEFQANFGKSCWPGRKLSEITWQ